MHMKGPAIQALYKHNVKHRASGHAQRPTTAKRQHLLNLISQVLFLHSGL